MRLSGFMSLIQGTMDQIFGQAQEILAGLNIRKEAGSLRLAVGWGPKQSRSRKIVQVHFYIDRHS